jgi:hypothetical protein
MLTESRYYGYRPAMTLSDWLSLHCETDAAFARRSGIGHKQLVGKYRRGLQIPSPVNMDRIRLATDGAVTANDFFHPAHAPAVAHRPERAA